VMVLWVKIGLAFLLDLALGDPRWLPHPVVIMGWFVARAEEFLRRVARTPLAQGAAGVLLTVVLVAGTYTLTDFVLDLAGLLGQPVSTVLEVLLLYTTLATRGLVEHVCDVREALRSRDLEEARRRLSRVVGRDTDHLAEAEVVRGVLETAAENTCDGVIAPLFYALMGGPPLAMAYKAVNTLDSMIGYQDERYLYFGRVAARLDDLANYLPARLTALLLMFAGALLGYPWRRAWRTVLADARRGPSPNSGFPEAAMAGLLGVRLGGPNCYRGVPSLRPFLGEEFPVPRVGDIDEAVRLVYLAAWMGLGFGMAVRFLVGRL